MISRFLAFSSIIAFTSFLAACSYIQDGSTQEVTFLTPGAYNAVCYAESGGVKQKIRPPQTVIIRKSSEAITVDCLAPGNRRKKVVIEPALEDSFDGNLAFVGATVPWDVLTESMFAYPDTIEVDFTHAPVKPEAMPAQNQPDLRAPEDYDLEEFKPGLPRLNSDKNALQHEIRRIRGPGIANPNQAIPAGPPTMDQVLGDAIAEPPTIDTYGGAIDPSGEESVDGDALPTPPAGE